MEDKPFISYVLDKFNLIGGIIGFALIIFSFVKTHNTWKSVSFLCVLFVILLIYSLRKLYKEVIELKRNLGDKEDKISSLTQKHDRLEQQFNNQSERYQKNIDEINALKGIVTTVKANIYTNTSESKAVKTIIDPIKYAIEEYLNKGDNGDV